MNFDNAPAQMIALVLGWSFTVYLQYRSNRRAESLKRKDKIVDKLEELADWVESEIEKENFSSVNTETTYSGMISQIEGRISQLNNHVGREIFDGTKLSALRDVEIHTEAHANNETPYKIREEVADIVEHIEVCCDAEYFSRKGFWANIKGGALLLNDYTRSFRGGVLALIFLLLFFAIYQFCQKYLVRPVGTCVYGAQCHLAPGLVVPQERAKHNFMELFKYAPGEKTAPAS
jgi:hypothetical protein